jgi:hypothetical protein
VSSKPEEPERALVGGIGRKWSSRADVHQPPHLARPCTQKEWHKVGTDTSSSAYPAESAGNRHVRTTAPGRHQTSILRRSTRATESTLVPSSMRCAGSAPRRPSSIALMNSVPFRSPETANSLSSANRGHRPAVGEDGIRAHKPDWSAIGPVARHLALSIGRTADGPGSAHHPAELGEHQVDQLQRHRRIMYGS